jgi:hypothetical protein
MLSCECECGKRVEERRHENFSFLERSQDSGQQTLKAIERNKANNSLIIILVVEILTFTEVAK